MNPQHSSSSLADQELNWHGTDTEELYQKNLVKHPEKIASWSNRPITYKFNSYGFRADEFDSDHPGVVFLGCSHTLGIGLPVESTWAHIVSTSLKLRNLNLAVGGASNDTAFRLAYYWINQLQPDLVVFLSTERTRLELHAGNDQIKNLSVWPHDFPMANDFMKYWHGNDINSNMNYLKNTLAVKQLCSENGIKYIQEEVSTITMLDKARDLQHYGVNTNQCIADMFLTKI